MPFQKGNKINLGRKRLDMIGNKFCAGKIPWNKGIKTGYIPWNKGLKYTFSETDSNTKCKKCKESFYCANWEKRGGRKYCSSKCFHASNRGKKAWNKGLKRWWDSSTEFKKGQTLGNKNVNWKDGKTKTEEFIRFTPEYDFWRKSVFKRDSYTCQECGIRGGRLNAEHHKPQSLFPELRFDINNGVTLCISCHKKTYSYLNPYMKREEFLWV